MGMEAAIIGASAISAIGGALSSSDGSSGTQSTSPWSYQAPYLHEGFKRADSAWYDATNTGRYTGDFVAGSNPNITGGINRMVGWSGGAEAAGNNLTNAGWAGMSGFGAVPGNINAVYDRAMGDPTGRTIEAAGAYANNPYMDGMVDASLRDVNRNLQVGLANNNSSAVGSGNMNSTRAGVTEALLTNAAQDRAADISSNMRGAAYNNGLNLASNQNQAGLTAALAANGQSIGAANAGANFVTSGLAAGQAGAQGQLDAGTLERSLQQAGLDNAFKRNDYARTADMDLVARYMQIVGGQQYGNNVNTTRTNNGDPFAAAVKGGLGAGTQLTGLAMLAGRDPFGFNNRPLSSGYVEPFAMGSIY